MNIGAVNNISKISNRQYVSFKSPYVDDLAYVMDDRVYERNSDDYSSEPLEKTWKRGLLRIHKRDEAEMKDLAESFHDFSDDDLLDVCKEAYWTSWGAIDNYRKLIKAVHEVQKHKKTILSEIAQLTKKATNSAGSNSSRKVNLTPVEKERLSQLQAEITRLEDKIYEKYNYKQ